MTIKKMMASLALRDLVLRVHLGWGAEERKKKQKVLLTLHIRFDSAPQGCQTDELEETVCYDLLINHIREEIAHRSFHLIEHLGAEIYRIAKQALPKKIGLGISLVKYPKISGLTGGVCFEYGE